MAWTANRNPSTQINYFIFHLLLSSYSGIRAREREKSIRHQVDRFSRVYYRALICYLAVRRRKPAINCDLM